MIGHRVRFREGLGLDPHAMGRRTVVPADVALAFLEEPRIRDTDWNADFCRKQHEAVVKFLTEMDWAMVEIQPFGIVVGDYWVQPYLVSPGQYRAMRELSLA